MLVVLTGISAAFTLLTPIDTLDSMNRRDHP